jgi:hypothetical protein
MQRTLKKECRIWNPEGVGEDESRQEVLVPEKMIRRK